MGIFHIKTCIESCFFLLLDTVSAGLYILGNRFEPCCKLTKTGKDYNGNNGKLVLYLCVRHGPSVFYRVYQYFVSLRIAFVSFAQFRSKEGCDPTGFEKFPRREDRGKVLFFGSGSDGQDSTPEGTGGCR